MKDTLCKNMISDLGEDQKGLCDELNQAKNQLEKGMLKKEDYDKKVDNIVSKLNDKDMIEK